MMKMIKDKLLKHRDRLILLIPVLISLLALTFSLEIHVLYKCICTGVLLILFLVFYYLVKYCEKDSIEKQEILDSINKLSNKYRIVTDIISFISTELENFSQRTNDIANKVINRNEVKTNDLFVNNYYCDEICASIRKTLISYVSSNKGNEKISDELNVNFITCIEEKKSKKIKMVGFAGEKPFIYEKLFDLDNCPYFFGELIRTRSPNFKPWNKNEISTKFYKKDSDSDTSKYMQYVGIPIYCSNNKIVGFLQIDTINDSVIGDNDDETKKVIKQLVIPYCSLLLLLHKLDKGLIAKPKNKKSNNRKR